MFKEVEEKVSCMLLSQHEALRHRKGILLCSMEALHAHQWRWQKLRSAIFPVILVMGYSDTAGISYPKQRLRISLCSSMKRASLFNAELISSTTCVLYSVYKFNVYSFALAFNPGIGFIWTSMIPAAILTM